MKPLRILLLNHNVAYQGGTFNRAFEVGRHLASRGHDVRLLSISPQARWTMESKRVDGLTLVETPDVLIGPGRTGWDLYDTFRRVWFLRDSTWDVIHAWDCRPAVILPALFAHRRSRGSALFLDWCDWWGRGGTIQERSGWLVRTAFGPIETFFEEAFRTRADRTTVISQALFDRAVRLGVPSSTIQLLRQGCDTETVSPGNRAEARSRLGIPPDAIVLGSVGVLLKNDALLLWDTLRALFTVHPSVRFVLIGRHKSKVPDDIVSYGRLEETGFVSSQTLTDYLAACDFMLTPLADTLAARARWPSKVNHYLAAGRATVISEVGDFPELLKETGAAAIASPTADDLARVASNLIANPADRLRIEERARRLAEEILAWPKLVAGLERAYFEALGR